MPSNVAVVVELLALVGAPLVLACSSEQPQAERFGTIVRTQKDADLLVPSETFIGALVVLPERGASIAFDKLQTVQGTVSVELSRESSVRFSALTTIDGFLSITEDIRRSGGGVEFHQLMDVTGDIVIAQVLSSVRILKMKVHPGALTLVGDFNLALAELEELGTLEVSDTIEGSLLAPELVRVDTFRSERSAWIGVIRAVEIQDIEALATGGSVTFENLETVTGTLAMLQPRFDAVWKMPALEYADSFDVFVSQAGRLEPPLELANLRGVGRFRSRGFVPPNLATVARDFEFEAFEPAEHRFDSLAEIGGNLRVKAITDDPIVRFNALRTLGGSIFIEEAALAAPQLERITGSLGLQNSRGASSLGRLREVHGRITIRMDKRGALTDLFMSDLQSIGYTCTGTAACEPTRAIDDECDPAFSVEGAPINRISAQQLDNVLGAVAVRARCELVDLGNFENPPGCGAVCASN